MKALSGKKKSSDFSEIFSCAIKVSRTAANNNGFRIGFISTQFTKILCCLLRHLSFAAAQEELKSYKKIEKFKIVL